MKTFLTALSFFTRIPIQLKNVSEKQFFQAMVLIPIVGLVIGLLMWGVTELLGFIGYVPAASLLLVIFYIYITGGLHLDGVADTADAIFSARDKERMFEIMKDSRLGSFGAIALILLILSLYICFSWIFDTLSYSLVALVPIMGRYAAVQLAAFSAPAPQGGGLGKGFCEAAKPWQAMVYALLILCATYFLYKPSICIAVAAVMIFTGLLSLYFKHKLGGITGDQVGLSIELGQIVFMFSCIVCARLY